MPLGSRCLNVCDALRGIELILDGGAGNAAWAISLMVVRFSSGDVVADELGDAVLCDKLESVRWGDKARALVCRGEGLCLRGEKLTADPEWRVCALDRSARKPPKIRSSA
jgi:hypothetical protein